MLNTYFVINNKNVINIQRVLNDNKSAPKIIDFVESSDREIVKNITLEIKLINDEYHLLFELPNDNYQYAIQYIINK